MSNSETNSDGYSLSRVWAFTNYYLPRIKKQILIYAAVSALCAVVCLLPTPEFIQMGLFVAVWTLLPLLFYCAPLIFAKGADSRIVERLMPVTAGEKLTFFYLYTLLVVPIAVYLLPILSGLIYINCPSIQTPEVMQLHTVKFHYFGMINLINIIGAMFISMTCFLCVEAARQNRILWGIVAVIVSNTILGVIGAILGGYAAFKAGLRDGLAGKESIAEENVKEYTNKILTDLNHADTATSIAVCVIIVITVITGIWTYRTLKRKDL